MGYYVWKKRPLTTIIREGERCVCVSGRGSPHNKGSCYSNSLDLIYTSSSVKILSEGRLRFCFDLGFYRTWTPPCRCKVEQ